MESFETMVAMEADKSNGSISWPGEQVSGGGIMKEVGPL